MCIISGVLWSSNLGRLWVIATGGFSSRWLQTPGDRLVVYIAILTAAATIAIYVLRKLRGEIVQHEPPASELISKFREMHSQGELSDEEFRTIKTSLAARLQQELKDSGEKGCDE